MSSIVKFCSFFLILTLFMSEGFSQVGTHIFPDRNFSVSGDTIWFQVLISPENGNPCGNVVHVQLANQQNQQICNVSVLCSDNIGHGYLVVSDSLSTGIYGLSSWMNGPENTISKLVNQRLISIYNRFDTPPVTSCVPDNEMQYPIDPNIRIVVPKQAVSTRENVEFKIEIPEDQKGRISQVFVIAGLSDPVLANGSTTYSPVTKILGQEAMASVPENDGILLKGTIREPAQKKEIPGAIVLLSISDTLPYLDYCISDSLGRFSFFFKNFRGQGNLLLQASVTDFTESEITLDDNILQTTRLIPEVTPISSNQQKQIQSLINASYYQRVFYGSNITGGNHFSMPAKFKYPFYGKPTRTIFPDLFSYFPNFE